MRANWFCVLCGDSSKFASLFMQFGVQREWQHLVEKKKKKKKQFVRTNFSLVESSSKSF